MRICTKEKEERKNRGKREGGEREERGRTEERRKEGGRQGKDTPRIVGVH